MDFSRSHFPVSFAPTPNDAQGRSLEIKLRPQSIFDVASVISRHGAGQIRKDRKRRRVNRVLGGVEQADVAAFLRR